tara:strand:- start:5325 stop:6122 length:798 start_codon:yes stop_codon:yes gene_type:complete
MKTKLPSLPLFTDTYMAETVHLTNEQLGIYTRLLCFAWTKNTKPFTTESAYRICQCKTEQCEFIVDSILEEFFKLSHTNDPNPIPVWTHKRLVEEHEYLQKYYINKQESGKRGASKRWHNHSFANGESMAPIPNPIPIPNNNNNFEIFWDKISNKRGSKKMAKAKYEKECKDQNPEELAKIFNYFSGKIKDKTFIPHVSTWLNQRRFEDEDVKPDPKKAIIKTFLPDGREYKILGDYGQYSEILLDGEKWYKHKFKNDEPLKKDI